MLRNRRTVPLALVVVGACLLADPATGLPSACGDTGVTPDGVSPGEWGSFTCAAPKTLPRELRGKCLRRPAYSKVEGAGCPPKQFCCPSVPTAVKAKTESTAASPTVGQAPGPKALPWGNHMVGALTLGVPLACLVLLMLVWAVLRFRRPSPHLQRPSWYGLNLSANIIHFPPSCPCCGGIADTYSHIVAQRTTGVRIVRTTSRGWNFPHCSTCLHHQRLWRSRNGWAFSCFLGLIAGAATYVATGQVWSETCTAALTWGTTLGVGLCVFGTERHAARALRACSSSCTHVGAAVIHTGWHGTIKYFMFTSRDYLGHLQSSNSTKVVY